MKTAIFTSNNHAATNGTAETIWVLEIGGEKVYAGVYNHSSEDAKNNGKDGFYFRVTPEMPDFDNKHGLRNLVAKARKDLDKSMTSNDEIALGNFDRGDTIKFPMRREFSNYESYYAAMKELRTKFADMLDLITNKMGVPVTVTRFENDMVEGESSALDLTIPANMRAFKVGLGISA